MKAVRSWARASARRLTFYAPYWIVNKTGLALNYRARLVFFFVDTPSIVSDLGIKSRDALCCRFGLCLCLRFGVATVGGVRSLM